MENTILTMLKKIRQLIENGWTQGAHARNSEGRSVSEYDDDAVCFCTIGAIRRVAQGDGSGYAAIIDLIKTTSEIEWVVMWNDCEDRTKEQVLEVLDKAIAKVGA